MKHTTLGTLDVSRIGLGAMSMTGAYGAVTDEAESIRTIHRALELGVTFFDTAEAYGPFRNEEIVGRGASQGRSRRGRHRHQVRLRLPRHASAGTLDSRPEHIRAAVEGSLRRLGTDYIDLLYQHRVDPETPIEDTVGAMAELSTPERSATSGCPRLDADDPPGPCRASDHRAAVGVLAVDAGSGERGTASAARARYRFRGVFAARVAASYRSSALPRGHPGGRRPAGTTRVSTRRTRGNLRLPTKWPRWPPKSARPGTGGDGLAIGARRAHRADPGTKRVSRVEENCRRTRWS